MAVVTGVLLVGGAYYATGPSYLSNPVVTATVQTCKGKGPDRFCTGTWPAGHGTTHHGGIDKVADAQPGDHVQVRAKNDDSATTALKLSTGGWIFREALAGLVIAAGIALLVLLYVRRHRYITTNPDRRPDLEARANT
ncbi:MAG: hypothetical protein WCA46_28815 [Actinocatenispora sp.]